MNRGAWGATVQRIAKNQTRLSTYAWRLRGREVGYGVVVVVQSLSDVQLFVTPWTAAGQASLSFTVSCSLLKLMSIKLVTPSNQFILCHPLSSCLQSFPASGSFPMSWLFTSHSQSIRASASVLPMTIQGWFLLGLTGLISLLSKGLSRVFSSTTIQKIQFFSAQPSLWSSFHIHTWLLGFGGRDIEKLCMAKIKTMFSNPEPLVLTLIYVSWTDTHCFFFSFILNWFTFQLEFRRGEKCDWFTPSTLNSLSSAGSSWICLPCWWSNGWKAPFPLLKEVLSRHVYSPFSCLFSQALKLTAFLQRKSLSSSSSIKVSFFIFGVLSIAVLLKERSKTFPPLLCMGQYHSS